MANENNIDGLIATNNPQIPANGLVFPRSYSSTPSPNRILSLFDANSATLYTKFGYYEAAGSGRGSVTQQPFFAVNPNNEEVGPLRSFTRINARKINDDRNFPIASTDEDIIRIRKFLRSSEGTRFIVKQTLLQGFQKFNETKIYNPLSPIIAVTRPGTLGLSSRPTRFIEPTLGGLLGAVGLSAISSLIGGGNPTPPAGTATGQPANFLNSINPFSSRLPGALPINHQDGGKGLTRGATATEAYKKFTDYWAPRNKGLLGRFLDIGNYIRANTLLGSLLPVGQPSGTIYKADENSYDLMIKNGVIRDKYTSPGLFGRIKSFFLGSSPEIPRFVWVDKDGNQQYGLRQKWSNYVKVDNGGKSKIAYEYSNVDQDGNLLPSQKKEVTSFYKYNGIVQSPSNQKSSFGDLGEEGSGYYTSVTQEQSEILANYDKYINNIRGTNPSGIGAYPTKLDNRNDPQVQLMDVQSDPFRVSNRPSNSWQRLKNQKTTAGKDGLSPRSSDSIITDEEFTDSTYIKRFKDIKEQLLSSKDGKKLDTSIADPINTSDVINDITNLKDRDLIRFWFYDIANSKYIPFRATMKVMNERYTSDWDNFQYIGNADKVYNYKGFTRSLSFSFSVVCMSIGELQPMWTRINYLLGLSKPAKYFNNEFIVPPLIKITIGDMYVNQPVVITNMGLAIPDNATWETLPADYKGEYNWENGTLLTNDSFAQMPMEADITIDCNLLEIKKPQVGEMNNFGWEKITTKQFANDVNINENNLTTA